jgi:TonB family C-terminal domain
MAANTNLPTYALKSELAHVSLRATERDGSRKLAWVNSICILFLLIGIIGSKSGKASIQPLPPLEMAVPAIVEPVPPPQSTAQEPQQESSENEKPDTPQVVVVTPEAPNINFAVPTIGNLVVANAIAKAPPLHPMQAPASLRQEPTLLENTGSGGERPKPPYPKIALDQGQQGKVILALTADEAGNIFSVEVKESSGFPVLDRSAVDFVKRRWTIPKGTRLAEVPINYRLKAD